MDVDLAWKAAVMGVVEGLTEFIPVSSTGHLIAVGELIGFCDRPDQKTFRNLFDVVIQLGAILAICVLYRAKLWRVAADVPRDPAARRFVFTLFLAFLPGALVGLATHHLVEEYLLTTAVVAATIALGGLAIIVIEKRTHADVHTDALRLPMKTVLAIGGCQCLALVLPGISRSGATIMGGLLLGVERKAATEFSFFLAIPTMFAASGYSLFKHHRALTAETAPILAIGFVVSFIVAAGVVAWLMRFVSGHTFTAFGWYRIAIGIVLALLMVAGLVAPRPYEG